MRAYSKLFIGIILTSLLTYCGGDIHDVSVSPTTTTVTVHKITTVTVLKTTTTTVDPNIFTWNAAVVLLAEAKEQRAKEQPKKTQSNHGPHSDSWWHGVSVCEQGGRNDSYFGYFSYMDGSAGGKSWADQVAMGNKTIARYGEDMMYGGAWAHKCVMAGYSASPGG